MNAIYEDLKMAKKHSADVLSGVPSSVLSSFSLLWVFFCFLWCFFCVLSSFLSFLLSGVFLFFSFGVSSGISSDLSRVLI